MKFQYLLYIYSLFTLSIYSQTKIDTILKASNKASIEYIYIKEISSNKLYTFLDTRKKSEFEVSHIKNAIWVGYTNFKVNKVKKRITDKNTPIIVYCSIGIRSEDIGEKLIRLGYTNVRNLYGGIFEWKNNNLPVYNNNNVETQKVHAYNQQWGKLLTKGEKVYN